jgi:hypothetical protein
MYSESGIIETRLCDSVGVTVEGVRARYPLDASLLPESSANRTFWAAGKGLLSDEFAIGHEKAFAK